MALKKRFQKNKASLAEGADGKPDSQKASGSETGNSSIPADANSKSDSQPSAAGPIDTHPQNSLNHASEAAFFKKQVGVIHRLNDLLQDEGTSLPLVFKGILDIVCRNLDSPAGSLWLFNKESEELVCRVAQGPTRKKVEGLRVPSGKGIIGWVVEKKRSTIVYDTDTDDRFTGNVDNSTGFKTQTLITCPILYSSEVIGAIQIVNKKDGTPFNDADERFLNALCTPIAMHIYNSRLIREQSKSLTRMEAVKSLHSLFGSTMDFKELMQLVMNQALELLGAEVGSLWLTSDDEKQITCHVAGGGTKDKVEGLTLNKGDGIVGKVVQTRKSEIVLDCSKDQRFLKSMDEKNEFVTKSMICVPLMVQNDCLGALQIINKKAAAGIFDHDDLELVQVFAATSSMYLRNAKLYEAEKKAEELAGLIDISGEITSTLDLNSVLISVVNLSNQIINYKEASISCEDLSGKGFQLSAVTGVDQVDLDIEKNKNLQSLHNLLLERGKELKILDPKNPGVDPQVDEALGKYLTENELESLWAVPLKDEQGQLGMLIMEADHSQMITKKAEELSTILVSQMTVALRNAMLYTSIPAAPLGERLRQGVSGLKSISLKKLATGVALVAGVVACLTLIHIQDYIAANIELQPVRHSYFAAAAGKIEQVLVQEGQHVEAGTVLAKLDTSELRLQLQQKNAELQKISNEAIAMQAKGDIAAFRVKELERNSLNYEIEILQQNIKNSTIIAETAGTVLTANPKELIGKPVGFAEEILQLAKDGLVHVRFEIEEGDIALVRKDQLVSFRLFAYPGKTFGDATRLRSVAAEAQPLSPADPESLGFFANSLLKLEQDESIRAGMTGHGKIQIGKKPLWHYLFRKPLAYLMLEVLF